MKVCLEPGCSTLTKASRCPDHARAKERARGTTAERGYGSRHRKLSESERARAVGQTCGMCGQAMTADQRLALDHTIDRTSYRGVVHLSCNSREPSQRTQTPPTDPLEPQ